MQVSRATEVTVVREGVEQTERVQDLAITLKLTADEQSVHMVPTMVDGGAGTVTILVELMEGARWWSSRPWMVDPTSHRVALPIHADDPMDIGGHEVARLVLDALQMAWIPLPSTPVGIGAHWSAEGALVGGAAVTYDCELVSRRGSKAMIDVALKMDVPAEAGGTLSVQGRVWVEEGRPLPTGAAFEVSFVLADGAPASGTEFVGIATAP